MALKSAIFLDKDGTVLRDVPYNVDPARMEFGRGVQAGLARLAALEWPVFIVSNQPGVALGLFGESALVNVHVKLCSMFAQAGVPLTGFLYCPHCPVASGVAGDEGCACRKPAPGLLLRAAAEHALDLRASWMIGDILDDIEAGNRAGCRTALIDNGNETEWRLSAARIPTLTEPDFDACIQGVIAAEAKSREVVT